MFFYNWVNTVVYIFNLSFNSKKNIYTHGHKPFTLVSITPIILQLLQNKQM